MITAEGPTTRVVETASGASFSFSVDALRDMAQQAREHFIPMSIEHLTLLPPIGRWYDAEVVALEDGGHQLLMHGTQIAHFDANNEIADPFAPPCIDPSVSTTEWSGRVAISSTLHAEARNFDSEVWDQISADAPLPIEPVHKWSALPPIEWIIAIPVTWGAVKFSGSFLETLGASSANGLASWISRASRRAKAPERDRFVTVAFEIDDGRTVYGFVPFSGNHDQVDVVHRAVDTAGRLAEIAGAQREGIGSIAHRIAYMFDGKQWRLAWFVTDEGAFRTRYFAEHMPQPERFLDAWHEPKPRKRDGRGLTNP